MIDHLCSQCGSPLTGEGKFCPNCGSSVIPGKAFAESIHAMKNPRKRIIVPLLIGTVLIVGFASYIREAFRTYHPIIEKQPTVSQPWVPISDKLSSSTIEARIEGPYIIVSLSTILEKKIVRFVDPENVQTIPILAYITPSGKLVTAMSISENCRSTDFYLVGENIHCASCPSYWNASSLEAYACCQKYYPDPIPSSVLGNEVRIDKNLIRNWQPRS